MAASLTATEVAALVGVDEVRVRKEVEHGLFGPVSPPRFTFADAVYMRILVLIEFRLGIVDRMKLHDAIGKAMASAKVPAKVELGPVLDVKLGLLAEELRHKLDRFEAWKKKLVLDERVLGGALVRGASRADLREDYPYLKDQDFEFAMVYTRAYPRVGRPRERQAPAG
jgi:hypothetical protein